jgi:hypothetical protein
MFCLCLYGEWLAANFGARGEGAAEAVREMNASYAPAGPVSRIVGSAMDTSIRMEMIGGRLCWPLNPVPRDWAIESAWNQEPYLESRHWTCHDSGSEAIVWKLSGCGSPDRDRGGLSNELLQISR